MMKKNALMLKKYGLNPHFKLYTKKQIKKMIKTNPDKVVNLFFTYQKILYKIIKDKLLSWGYQPSRDHSPIKLKKGEIKFKTKRKKMTKAEKKIFLARLNKGRKKAGLKPIRAKR
tara:strand:- start:16 stop:360 length:345 start_codon:yes stop_codon:yes gene_type:complete